MDAGVADADAAPSEDAGRAAGYCPVVGYAPCGGDLIGTWAFRALCPEDPEAAAALCEHPFDDRVECTGAGNEARCDGAQTGTLIFAADGTLEVDTTVTLVATWGFSDACLESVARAGATPAERCASLTTERLECAYDGACSCVGAPIVESDTNTSTYAIDGLDVTLGDNPPASYCVDGDTLTMDYYVFHPVSWRYWVLERE